MKLLIIEDDEEIIEAISLAFQIRWSEAHIVSTHNGRKGVELVETEMPDVVILDLGLPDISGFDVLKQIRQFSQVPIIIVTVLAEEAAIIKGLEWGADDYIIKPFRQLELLARIKAQIPRKNQDEETQVISGSFKLNSVTGQLSHLEREVSLTITETSILSHLMKNAGYVVTHSSLAEVVWGDDYPGAADSVKVHIRRLREKIEENPSNPQFIITKSGIGYLFSKKQP
ncbi:response regulator transcription factor [Chloroflexota bacterium]